MAMRRPLNSGSVIKLPGKRRRPYAARIYLGVHLKPDGNGTLKYKYVGYFEKRAEALQYLEKYNTSPVELVPVQTDTRKHKFSEIYELYIKELEKTKKNLGIQAYKSRAAAFKLLHPLHNMTFETLELDDIENVTDSLSHMSDSTMANIKTVLKGMYKTAMRHKYVDEDLSALMITSHYNENANPHTPFTDDEIETLWNHTDLPEVRLYLILIYTGMRVNELLSMKSEDVHLEDRYMVGGSKTAAGKNRMIPIAEKIVPFIDTSNEYLIFPHMTYNVASNTTKLVLQSLGMDHTFHDARHTCASLMEKAEIDILHRKLILGHKSSDITDRYTHVDIATLTSDINRI